MAKVKSPTKELVSTGQSADNFPELCPFCRASFKVRNCLLPFAIANSIVRQENEIDNIVEIGRIHQVYGLDKLRQTSEAMKLSSFTLTSESDVQQVVEQKEIQIKDEISENVKSTETKDETISSDSIIKDNFPKLPPGIKPESGGSPKVISFPINPKRSPKSWSDYDKKDDNLDDLISELGSKPSENHSPVKEERRTSSSTEEYTLSECERIHLFQDVLIAYKGIYHIKESSRMHLKQWKTFDALKFEANIRRTKRKGYITPRILKVDGDISLSKIIHSLHSQEQYFDWETGNPIRDTKCCILNSTPFQKRTTSQTLTVHDALAAYIAEIRMSKDILGHVNNELLPLIQFTLEKSGIPNAFKLGNSEASKFTSRFINVGKDDVLGYNGKPPVLVEATPKLKPYPPIDEDVKHFIEHNASSCVHRILNLDRNKEHSVKGFDNVETFYLKLTSEFIRRNANWKNPNSFSNAKRLAELEGFIGTKIPDIQSKDVFNNLKDILIECRTKFKELSANVLTR